MEDQKQVEKRLGWLAIVIVVWGAVILFRLVMLQVVHHRDYLKAARKAQEIEIKVPAARGSISDRNGRLLAMSTRLDTVFVNPQEVPDVGVASDLVRRDPGLPGGRQHARPHPDREVCVAPVLTAEALSCTTIVTMSSTRRER